MIVPNRHGAIEANVYRYGFQGQEKDDEIKGGEGKSLNYTFRMHDPRIGRFFALDPLFKEYPELTPYQFSSNSPIDMIELEGLEGWLVNSKNEVYYQNGPAINTFDSEESAQRAASMGIKTPKQLEEADKSWQAFLARTPKYAKPLAEVRSDNLQAQVYKYRDVNPGLSISRGILDGAQAAPEVIIPEIAFAKVAKIYKLSKLARNTTIAGSELSGTGVTGKGLMKLSTQLNPTGSRFNCVLVSIEFQKKLLKQVYTASTSTGGKGLSIEKMMSYLYANFSQVNINYSFSKSYKALVGTLEAKIKSSNSSIIIGKLSRQTGEVTDHAFNAVKSSDGSWKFLDMQTGVQYTEKGMEKTFSSYKIIEVK